MSVCSTSGYLLPTKTDHFLYNHPTVLLDSLLASPSLGIMSRGEEHKSMQHREKRLEPPPATAYTALRLEVVAICTRLRSCDLGPIVSASRCLASWLDSKRTSMSDIAEIEDA